MTKEEKVDIFKTELSFIKDLKIKQFVEDSLNILPEYFFKISASSTGKHHPSYALGEGGLIRHTKAAVRIAVELFDTEMFNYSDRQKDIIIASLILHDGCKLGLEHNQYTVTEHPLIVAELLKKNNKVLDEYTLNVILNNIKTHMGRWNQDYKTKKEVLPLPTTGMQKFVHMCDYLASRKCLEFNFEVK